MLRRKLAENGCESLSKLFTVWGIGSIPSMNQNRLFCVTRLRLAGWYAGIMSLILSLFGFAVYEAIAYSRWKILERDVEFASDVLQHNLEPTLAQPGVVQPDTQKLLSNVCLLGQLVWVKPLLKLASTYYRSK
jgi:hypothetical protein